MSSSAPPTKSSDREANTWAMMLHLSLLAGLAVPLLGFIAPVLIWQLKKDQFPILEEHGRNVVNWILSSIIYSVVGAILTFILIGFLILGAVFVCSIAFPIIGGIKAYDGVVWKYPLTINFL